MRYRENREQTAELLRMVLPMMSRHAAGFHPLSYAVWYEYAAGTNQALRAALDSRTAANHKLTDSDIEELFDRYVAMRDIESSMRIRARIQEVVAQVSETTHQAGAEVGRYSEGLNSYQERLQRDNDPEVVAHVVGGLIHDTHRVRERTSDLQRHLATSSRDAQALQGELESAQGRSQMDPLTGLLSRRGLEMRVRDEFPDGLPAGALLRVAVDQFAVLSDQVGHLLADRVLASIGKILQTNAPNTSLLARTGGEQFVLWIPGVGLSELTAVAERIRAAVEQCRIRRQDSDPDAARTDAASLTQLTVSIGAVELKASESLNHVLEALIQQPIDAGITQLSLGSPALAQQSLALEFKRL